MCGVALRVDSVLWCMNQIMDQLAKDSAEGIRVSQRYRNWAEHNDAKIFEFAIYMGKLTYEANHCLKGDKLCRDSEPMKPKGRCKAKTLRSRKGASTCVKVSAAVMNPGFSSMTRWRMPKKVPLGPPKPLLMRGQVCL